VNRKVTRRDFLDGVGVTVGGAVLASSPSWLHGLEVADLTSVLEKDPSGVFVMNTRELLNPLRNTGGDQ